MARNAPATEVAIAKRDARRNLFDCGGLPPWQLDMRTFPTLLRHEIRTLLVSPATYIAAVLFLGLMAGLYVLILAEYAARPLDVLPSDQFFELFWLPVFFMTPLLTMRSIAEERRLGTLEALLTTPVGAGAVVLAKFIAAYLLYLALWGVTLGFPFAVNATLESDAYGAILTERATLVGGFAFVAVSGILFTAVGIFSSSLTRSQLVAGMLTFSILFIIVLGPPVLQEQPVSWLEPLQAALQAFNLIEHLADFRRGVVDTRPLIFYGINASLILGLAILQVEAKA